VKAKILATIVFLALACAPSLLSDTLPQCAPESASGTSFTLPSCTIGGLDFTGIWGRDLGLDTATGVLPGPDPVSITPIIQGSLAGLLFSGSLADGVYMTLYTSEISDAQFTFGQPAGNSIGAPTSVTETLAPGWCSTFEDDIACNESSSISVQFWGPTTSLQFLQSEPGPDNTSAAPEPASLILVAFGVVFLTAARRVRISRFSQRVITSETSDRA
jgi:hypothetical protein